MVIKIGQGEENKLEQLREHYRIEKELSDILRAALPDERGKLYSVLYDEFYKRVPKRHPDIILREVFRQMDFLRRFLDKSRIFLELGPGDCALSFTIAPFVKEVIAIDVSKEISITLSPPENFQLIISDGCNVPLKENSVSIVYSYQLMEHLHPDDALRQLKEIQRVLAPGGVYVCVTPNRINGPHDVSKYFDEVATGFHLKEYTTGELSRLFKMVGFASVRAYCGARNMYLPAPTFLIRLVENFLLALPSFLRRPLSSCLPARILLGIRLIGRKKYGE